MESVIDTNVFVGALQRGDGVNRKILELCFLDELEPLMTDTLYFEYESLMGRAHLFENSMFYLPLGRYSLSLASEFKGRG